MLKLQAPENLKKEAVLVRHTESAAVEQRILSVYILPIVA